MYRSPKVIKLSEQENCEDFSITFLGDTEGEECKVYLLDSIIDGNRDIYINYDPKECLDNIESDYSTELFTKPMFENTKDIGTKIIEMGNGSEICEIHIMSPLEVEDENRLVFVYANGHEVHCCHTLLE